MDKIYPIQVLRHDGSAFIRDEGNGDVFGKAAVDGRLRHALSPVYAAPVVPFKTVVAAMARLEYGVLEYPVPHLEILYPGTDLDDLTAPFMTAGEPGTLSAPLPPDPRIDVHDVADAAGADLDYYPFRGTLGIGNVLVFDVARCIINSCLHSWSSLGFLTSIPDKRFWSLWGLTVPIPLVGQ